jgi:RNA-binding protein YhbY
MEKREKILKKQAAKLVAEMAVGKNGITLPITAELKKRLAKRKFVKIKVHKSFQASRDRIGEKLALDCKATLLEVKGNTIVLYKQHAISAEGKSKTKEKQIRKQTRENKRKYTAHKKKRGKRR